jgi:undecaprenyl-diphosphatase
MLKKFDDYIFNATEGIRQSWLRNVLYLFSFNPKGMYLVLLLINFIFLQNTILLNILVFFAGDIFIWVLKRIIRRTRPVKPSDSLFKKIIGLGPDQFSFPSAHTFTAFQILPLCFSINSYFGILVGVYACLVALSRIILKHHYASDVFASIPLGIISGLLNIILI